MPADGGATCNAAGAVVHAGYSWAPANDAQPSADDLKAAVERRPELVYSIVAEQQLGGMEDRLKKRSDEIRAKQDDFEKLYLMRKNDLEAEQAAHAALEKKLKERKEAKDKLRSEIRTAMEREAKAAEEEAGFLEAARKSRLELEAHKQEAPKIEAEYRKAQEEEKAQKFAFQDEKMALRGRHAAAVRTLDDQTREIKEKTKELKNQGRKYHDLIELDKSQTAEQEKWIKEEREKIKNGIEELNKHTESVKFKTKETARKHQEAFWATSDTNTSALGHMSDANK